MSEKLPIEFVFNPEFGRDPYAAYATLRDKGPVHAIDFPPGMDAFLIIGHEHGRPALGDPRLAKDMRHGPALFREFVATGNPVLAHNMLNSDPPDHTRLRRLVSKAFTPRRVESLRPRIQEITDGLIDAMTAKGHADLLDDFAFPLPIIVICELLGIPSEDRDDFRDWSAALVNPTVDEEQLRHRAEMGAATRAYFTRLIAERRAEPRDDMVSALVAASDDEELLSEQELLSTLILLLIAGHETTVNLIGNGMLALLTHPDQLQLLQDKPELLPSAIEEFLRYDGPVERATFRFAAEDLEIAGVHIPQGSIVHISLGAVDHDPEAFDAPETLDITRTDNRHVAFGHGIHFCLGAPLARLEAQIAFGTLLRRLPGIELSCAPSEVAWRQTGSIVRGLRALPVSF
ncbi:cytochrome P450 family protein [Streptosporangium lutulentum]|uniref:Cytochrome P450 n=1 Tax=Streptosporangium lutulentum TaxID=1461250 RepID=A0ABT9QFP8_9ACTN|nr:cytochrome P450 [Streptosporangium lutulentum]MDP9844764.1 cytochrome P450 [Streptosporangium lutulentum]